MKVEAIGRVRAVVGTLVVELERKIDVVAFDVGMAVRVGAKPSLDGTRPAEVRSVNREAGSVGLSRPVAKVGDTVWVLRSS